MKSLWIGIAHVSDVLELIQHALKTILLFLKHIVNQNYVGCTLPAFRSSAICARMFSAHCSMAN
jgi:hypothetical protein